MTSTVAARALACALMLSLAIVPASRATGKTVYDNLAEKKFDDAIRMAKDGTKSAADSAAKVAALRDLVLSEAAAEDDARTADALRDLDQDAAPWIRGNWYAAIELAALQLARADSGASAASQAFRRFERLMWIGGEDDARAGSTLCGIAIGFTALGWDDAARRAYGAAGARLARVEDHPALAAGCVLDRIAYTSGAWGLASPEQARSEALNIITSSYPQGLAAAAAEYVAGRSPNRTLLAIPENARVSQISARMASLPKEKDELFMDLGDGLVFPRGFMTLVPGCEAPDHSGIGVVLLPRGKRTEEQGIEAADANARARVQRMGDVLARVELARRGVLISGASIKHSGHTAGSLAQTVNRVPSFLRSRVPGLTQIDEIREQVTFFRSSLGALDKFAAPSSPESLMDKPTFRILFDIGGKNMLSIADNVFGQEIYSNPRIPYMDWGAREIDYGCGAVVGGHGAQRAWATSEVWRAANLKKYVALNSIARNERGATAEDRLRIRRQMTTYWECVVADARVHLQEEELDKTGGARAIDRALDELHARERRRDDRIADVNKIADSDDLRKAREVYLPADLKRARAAEDKDLTRVLPAGTLLITLSTTRRNTSVLAALVSENPELQPKWCGYGVPIPRDAMAARSRALLDRLAGDAPESEVLEQGGALFDELFGRQEILDLFGKCKRVVIAPNGPAGDIPFNALAWTHDGKREFLGLALPVSITESVAMLRLAREDTTSHSSVAAFVVGAPKSAPVHEMFTDKVFPPGDSLASAAGEANDIAGQYAVHATLGAAATESRVREGFQGARVVHVATHGFIPSDTTLRAPLSAGFWTAPDVPATDTGGDGVIQAWEIVTQMSSNADLVVLSACETGSLWTQRGTIGELARSVLYAGAHTVLVSQWAVSDETTKSLMVSLHQSLRKGMAKDEALMKAMQKVHADSPSSSPGLWAAFRCAGLGW